MPKAFRLDRPDAARVLGTCCALALLASSLPAQTPLGTSFTYQGRLTQSGAPASGPFDLEFRLFGVDTGGSDVAAPVVIENVQVTSGLFAVSLDFGAAAFAGQKRWLEIGVRPGASTGAFTPLAGRQELAPTPNAVFSATAGDAATLGGVSASGYRLTGGLISVAEGGTGATTAAAARTNLQAAQSGANADITAISGLTTALSVAQGGTGSTTAAGALTALGAQAQLVPHVATTLDTAGGLFSSAKLGSDGLVLISYQDNTNNDLKVAHCSNAQCTSATVSTLDSVGPGQSTSLAIGADGLGLISYAGSVGGGNIGLKVAHCTNVACTSATTTTIDSLPMRADSHTSIAIGTDNLGLISYSSGSDVKVAHCQNTACTSATVSILEDLFDGGLYSSLAIGADGRGLISYLDLEFARLRVAHCSNVACTTAAITTIASGLFSSVTIGADGLGLISYLGVGDLDLKVAHCSDVTCSAATQSVLDNLNGGSALSITRGPDEFGIISYYESGGGNLKLARCANAACTSAALSILDSVGNVGRDSSVVLGADGRLLVSYFDDTNVALNVIQVGAIVGIAEGGTGATDASDARANLQAAQGGANSDITSLTGLTTALSVTQGGTGANTAADGRANLQAAKSGSNSDITQLTGLTGFRLATGVVAGHVLTTDASGNGTWQAKGVTSVASGAGLTGGPITTTGTLAVDFTASTGTASSAARADHNHDTTYASIGHNHDATYASAAAPAAALSTLDAAAAGAAHTSATTGSDGRGLISYADTTTGHLKVAHCADAACSSATVTTLNTGPVTYTSITIGTDGFGLISFYASDTQDLKVVHCTNTACTAFGAPTTLDSTGNVGSDNAITIGADGFGLIGYHNETSDDLKVVHCTDTACSTFDTPATIDTIGDLGQHISITIGADGLGLISHFDNGGKALKVAHCSNTACSSATNTTLDTLDDVGQFTSIAIGVDGFGLISYYDVTNGDLKVAHCTNTACTAAGVAVVDSTGLVGKYSSLAIGADGLGLISYHDETNGDLKVAHCTNIACTSTTGATLAASATNVLGTFTSATVGGDGLGLISYVDTTSGDLKVAHCQNLLCSPFVVRRR